MAQRTQLEHWMTLQEIAAFFKSSPRWIEYRMKDGMPSAMVAGRRKFRASECEDWLEKEGFLTRDDGRSR